VNGTVNSRGLEMTFHFEYGPTDAYGSSTPAAAAGAGHVDVPARADLKDLTPGTTYHYRLVATSDAGTSNGEDRQFQTPSA
jgi:phosphodiesterase/alkaline phosphatase D-like protein